MSGYVRIHRSLIGHPAFRNDAEAMAFAWMIARACWKPERLRYKGHGIHLDRGQLAISQRDMAAHLDRDKAWVERLWKRLKAEAMIEVGCEAGVAVITICNYTQYQAGENRLEAVGEARSKAPARQAQGTEEGREEGKEVRSEAKASSHVAPVVSNEKLVAVGSCLRKAYPAKQLIPADWIPPLMGELPPRARACAEQWTDGSYQTEGEAFVCYWRSERKMKADWRGTWANRIIARHSAVMRDQKFGNAPPDKPKGAPTADESRAILERFANQLEGEGRHADAAEYRKRSTVSVGNVAQSILRAAGG